MKDALNLNNQDSDR